MVLRPGAEPGVEGYWEEYVDESDTRRQFSRSGLR